MEEIEILEKKKRELMERLSMLDAALNNKTKPEDIRAFRPLAYLPATYRPLCSSRPMINKGSKGYLNDIGMTASYGAAEVKGEASDSNGLTHRSLPAQNNTARKK